MKRTYRWYRRDSSWSAAGQRSPDSAIYSPRTKDGRWIRSRTKWRWQFRGSRGNLWPLARIRGLRWSRRRSDPSRRTPPQILRRDTRRRPSPSAAPKSCRSWPATCGISDPCGWRVDKPTACRAGSFWACAAWSWTRRRGHWPRCLPRSPFWALTEWRCRSHRRPVCPCHYWVGGCERRIN